MKKGFTPHHFKTISNLYNLKFTNLFRKKKNKKYKNGAGFTLIEIMIVVAVLVILVIASVSSLVTFRKKSSLNNSVEEITSIIEYAQNKTLASEGSSQYGVYFDTTTSPHEYILFKGSNFLSRDVSFDKVYKVFESVEFYDINLNGGNEIVFKKITGMTDQVGSISLRLKNDNTETETIHINGVGNIGLNDPAIPLENLVIDSRHLHFNYNRLIDVATESIFLTFPNNGEVKEIIISDYLKDGIFNWEGEINVGGEVQKLKIHTHMLNNPNSQFCIHRDRRYNNESLIISISADGSGNVVEYSGDGLTTNYSSIYVEDLIWQ